MKKLKRKIDVLVLSDVHLGTYGCRAKELLHYLEHINPKVIVLNGDIIDIWQFNKRYWPKSHMKVIKHLLGWISKGKKVYYITGNHDEMLRKFDGFRIGSFRIVNKLVLELENGTKAWIFHGDVFDVTMKHSKWLVKLGAIGYDSLIIINSVANFFSEKLFKRGKISLSKRIKNSVKSALKFINDFEQISADIGIMNSYDYVICGHIHQPVIKTISNNDGSIMYLNSGDWIENLTSLEYVNGQWSIYKFSDEELLNMVVTNTEEPDDLSDGKLFDKLLEEFKLLKS
jgi:UDP-2,3-diacylglucosamine pyrophosphatase LpxH